MFVDVGSAWVFGQSALTAVSGLGGVLLGALMTAGNQKAERTNARRREQLQDFYSPMIGMRAEIKAKIEVRLKLETAASSQWPKEIEGVRNPETYDRISKGVGSVYKRQIDYDSKQWEEVLIPLYRRMLTLFATHMWLAAPSTLKHYPKLVEYVEILDRYLVQSIPGKVLEVVGHTENELLPFYEDLQCNFDRLTRELGISK